MKPIGNHEYARTLLNLNRAMCEQADILSGPAGEESLRAACAAANMTLGNDGLRDYEGRIPKGLVASQEILQQDFEEMRELLVSSRFASDLQNCTKSTLPICFLATGDPNAEAFPAPDGSPVVKIEAALQTWLAFVNRMLFRCAEADRDHKSRKEEFLRAIRPWTEFSFGISEGRDIATVRDKFISTCAEPFGLIMSVQMTDWQVLWVLAHELAHISLGHFSCLTKKTLRLGGKEQSIDWYLRSQQQEFAADLRGTEYFLAIFEDLKAQQNIDAVVLASPMMLGAPLVCLAYLSYYEMLMWRPGQPWSSTHPMAKRRAERLRNTLKDSILASPEAETLLALVEEMVLKASYAVFDELGVARPGELPPGLDLNWSLGSRLD